MLTVVIVILFVVFAVMNMPVGKATIGIGIFYILNILIELSGILYGNKTGKKDKRRAFLSAPGMHPAGSHIGWTASKSEPTMDRSKEFILFHKRSD